jgi:peptidyl-Asp metalloendopeptidase
MNMHSCTLTARVAFAAAFAGVLSLTSLNTIAAGGQPVALFLEQKKASNVVPPQHAVAGKVRRVTLDRKALGRDRLMVNLPGGVSFEALSEFKKDHGNGRSSWAGHARGNQNDTVVLGISGDAVAGTFRVRNKMFKLEPRANGDHVVSEVRATEPAQELDPIAVADNGSSGAATTSGGAAAASAGGAVIDVLVAYTPAIENLYGPQGVDALILQAVAETNQAYSNSGMTTRLNHLASHRTNYYESGNMETDLTRLRAKNDGFMDDVHAVRDFYGADLVSLIEHDPGSCGIAYRMTTLSASFASSAFSVVHHGCFTGYYSFAHEIGHNQGAHHDAPNATGKALYPDAYGYQHPASAFRTIMSYACVGGCARINHFSNANRFYQGAPTGVVGYSENADAIDRSAPTVAAFRQRVTALPPGC